MVAIVVSGIEGEDDVGEGNMMARVCSVDTVILPSFPENIPFFNVLLLQSV